MSEKTTRKSKLKELILKLHAGEDAGQIKIKIGEMMLNIPSSEIVEVEQELIAGGLPVKEVQRLCDIHHYVIEDAVDKSKMKDIPLGHPVDTFINENIELLEVCDEMEELFVETEKLSPNSDLKGMIVKLRNGVNNLADIEKHYQRKENLLFPYLEKKGITGPPKVMWAKHDEVRKLVKDGLELIYFEANLDKDKLIKINNEILSPLVKELREMCGKEENVLFPLAMDKLSTQEWFDIYNQTDEIGFTLIDPIHEWKPENIQQAEPSYFKGDTINLPTGRLSVEELIGIFKMLPVEVSFVDSEDKVKYFSHGRERIFQRNRAVLNRDVRLCHPPKSVRMVERILKDFKSGKETMAEFWINFDGKFVYITYYAVRDEEGSYLGTLEVVQDATRIRQLGGEQRLLSYVK